MELIIGATVLVVLIAVVSKALDKIKERKLRRAIDKFLIDGINSIS